MKPRSDYLTEDWYDPITHEYFCAECHEALERRGEVLRDHVLGLWRHYAYVDYPGVKATDEKGRTLEDQWAREPRRAKVLIPLQTHLRFCRDCFPLVQEHGVEGCYECREAVLDDHEISQCEFLWKRADGYNGPLITATLHLGCLPDHFIDLRAYRGVPKRT